MVVALDARMLGDRLHGLGRLVWGTADYVSRLAPEERFILLGRSRWSLQLAAERANLSVVDVAARPFSLSEQWQVPRALLRLRPHLYHGVSAAMPLYRPVPYVMTIPDLIPLLFHGRQLSYRLYFQGWLPWCARRARRVIVLSQAAREDVLRHLRLPPSKIEVVPPGVDVNFQPAAAPHEASRLLERYGVRAPYVLLAGNPKPYKNLPRGLALLERLLPELDPALSVVVLSAAGGALDGAMARFFTPVRLTHVPYIEEEDLAALYRQARVFFYPSLYEGFGLPVLEAMACGTVVVSSQAPSLCEVVGHAGLLVDVGNIDQTLHALRAALHDDSLRHDLRAAGLAQAARFTWKLCAQRTLQIYREAL